MRLEDGPPQHYTVHLGTMCPALSSMFRISSFRGLTHSQGGLTGTRAGFKSLCRQSSTRSGLKRAVH